MQSLTVTVSFIRNNLNFLVQITKPVVNFAQSFSSFFQVAFKRGFVFCFLDGAGFGAFGHRLKDQEIQHHGDNQKVDNLPNDGANVQVKHGLASKEARNQRVGKQQYQNDEQNVNRRGFEQRQSDEHRGA